MVNLYRLIVTLVYLNMKIQQSKFVPKTVIIFYAVVEKRNITRMEDYKTFTGIHWSDLLWTGKNHLRWSALMFVFVLEIEERRVMYRHHV